jgi:hypothetical protein
VAAQLHGRPLAASRGGSTAVQTTSSSSSRPLVGHGRQQQHHLQRGRGAVQEEDPEGEEAGPRQAAGHAAPAAVAADAGVAPQGQQRRRRRWWRQAGGQRRRRAAAARVRPHPSPDPGRRRPADGVRCRAAQSVRVAKEQPGGGAVVAVAADHTRLLRHVGAGHCLRHALGELGPGEGRIAAGNQGGSGQLAGAPGGRDREGEGQSEEEEMIM